METSIELAVIKLRDNRLMKSDEQLAVYEQTLDEIGDDEDVTNIPALCLGFDDRTEHREVMSGLISIIEGYDSFSSIEEQLKYFLQGAPNMLPHASDWLRTMLVRIINDAGARLLFKKLLASGDPSSTEAVRTALHKIAVDDAAKFEAKVKEVL
jgi:Immunity protein 30